MGPAVSLLCLGLIPGALIFRLPAAQRDKRAALPADERMFWSVVLSLVLSSCVALGLAIANRYTLDRVIWADVGVSLCLLLAFRQHLRLGAAASRLSWTAVIPVAIILLGAWVNVRVPPAEYVMGGRDPGVYFNEGIRIAQRGGATAPDDLARSVPGPYRELFFPAAGLDGTFTARFMSFYLLNPDAGTVVGQFPIGFPVWVAIGYGVNGLSGARAVPGICAMFGLLAVYFAGTRLAGRPAALAAAALLAVNVVQVWYGRYPNAEILLQPLVFTGLLAYVRAVHDEDRFFAPIAALLLVLAAFTHLTGTIAAALVAGAAVIHVFGNGGRVSRSFWITLAVGILSAAVYLWRSIPPYFEAPAGFVSNLTWTQLAIAAALTIAGVAVLRAIRRLPPRLRNDSMAGLLTLVIWSLAAYAYFIRTAGGRLALHDAESLRMFTQFYLSPYGLLAALIGFALLARVFPVNSAFLLVVGGFAVLFFFKIRIVPEHFWAARRFLAVILPGTLLLVGAAAFSDHLTERTVTWSRRTRRVRAAAGLVLVLVIGQRYVSATQPILHHVEYAGLVPHLEQLSARFGEQDSVLVESRGNSDTHVLALPMAYIYSRNVLVFATMAPPKPAAREFITWAQSKYRHVFFLGSSGSGVDLLWRSMRIGNIHTEHFGIPEYEPAINAFPTHVKHKEFDLVVYEFLREPVSEPWSDLDVGGLDDPYVQAFYARERRADGSTFRWTRDVSTIGAVGLRGDERTVTLWMDNGGRPPSAGIPAVQVYLDDTFLGQVVVGAGVAPDRLEIPPEKAATLGRGDDDARVRLVTSTWSPARLLGGADTRDLGVILDRVEVH